MNLPDILFKTISKGKLAFDEIIENNAFEYVCIEVNCADFTKPIWDKEQKSPSFWPEISRNFPNIKKPCLYYFEIIDPNTKIVLEAYKKFRNNKELKHRASAALKKQPPLYSNVLYVGKVKDGIFGRMYVHFGYYYLGATAGLQLACWANEINLQLRLHIYSFNEIMHDFVSSLELSFAHSLNPLIGKH